MHDEKVDIIYSSPLQRCLDTITPFAKKEDLEIYIDPRITENRFDCMQDISWEDKKELEKELHDWH